jgi:hypothetical protein
MYRWIASFAVFTLIARRLQRGKAAFEAGKKLAAEHGWKFAWRLVEADGIDHDHQKMFANEQCERALFGP